MKRILIAIALCITFTSFATERKFENDYNIEQSKFNSSAEESGLSLLNGKLAFSRNDSIYQAEIDDSFDIKEIVFVEDLSKLGIEGTFAQVENTIYFSSGGDLYSADLNNGTWSNPQKLKIDSLSGGRKEYSGSSFAHRRWTYKSKPISGLYNPTVTPDGSRIYFSADFENGAGGRDIWYIDRKENGKAWYAPKNAGYAVNTSADEDFPFLAGDSALYFSSSRTDTLGSVNIFKSFMNRKAKMLAADFNSANEDFNFVATENCIFLVSDRNGNRDIYRPGLIVLPPDTVATDSVAIDSIPADTMLKDLNIIRKDFNTVVFYFNFNKTSMISEYEKEFEYIFNFINESPDSEFAITGHTDERGSDSYNLRLSRNRAREVYNKLVKMGVKTKLEETGDRFVVDGLGEQNPEIKGAKTEEEHQKNRRVEIKKLD